MKPKPPVLKCFRPLADPGSRILILGTMPGPEALRRREYYGFPGNHFWKIMADLFGRRPFASYAEKKAFLRERRIALWDVIGSCTREGALDVSIRSVEPNPIPDFVSRRRLNAIFLNGGFAERLYRRHFGGRIHLPAIRLPSTSPAHASLSYARKLEAWKAVLPYLENRNPWC
jgi:hypoxanthine-DNA glycosylase